MSFSCSVDSLCWVVRYLSIHVIFSIPIHVLLVEYMYFHTGFSVFSWCVSCFEHLTDKPVICLTLAYYLRSQSKCETSVLTGSTGEWEHDGWDCPNQWGSVCFSRWEWSIVERRPPRFEVAKAVIIQGWMDPIPYRWNSRVNGELLGVHVYKHRNWLVVWNIF